MAKEAPSESRRYPKAVVLLSFLVLTALSSGSSSYIAYGNHAEQEREEWGEAVLGKLDVAPSLKLFYYHPSDAEALVVDAGAYLDIEYSWKVGSDYSPPGAGARAFVHFRDESGRIIADSLGKTFQDDHDISPSPDEWKPGMEVTYTRQMIKVPDEIGRKEYDVSVCVGIYNPSGNRRAELTGAESQPADLAYPVAEFKVKKNEDRYPLTFEKCFYPEPPDYKWRWGGKVSEVQFKRDYGLDNVDLVLAGHSPAEEIGGRQKIWIYIHEEGDEFLVKELLFEKERIDPLRIAIPNELYNATGFKTAIIRFIFKVEPHLVPKGGDTRGELGFKFREVLLLPREQ